MSASSPSSDAKARPIPNGCAVGCGITRWDRKRKLSRFARNGEDAEYGIQSERVGLRILLDILQATELKPRWVYDRVER